MALSLYLLLVLMIAVAASLWWFLFRRHDKSSLPAATASHHHGVMIIPGPHPCSQVTELWGRRMLAREAPLLPLSGCNSGHCQCTYRHLKDRRQPDERRHDNVDIDKQHKRHEKRSGHDRRYSLR